MQLSFGIFPKKKMKLSQILIYAKIVWAESGLMMWNGYSLKNV